MKAKLRDIVNSVKSFKMFLACPIEIDMDISYKLSTIATEYDKHLMPFEKAREKLREKYVKNGIINPDDEAKAAKELSKTLDLDIDFNSPKIPRGLLKGIKLPYQVTVDLHWILEG